MARKALYTGKKKEQLKEKARKMLVEGKSWKEAAEATEVSMGSLRAWLKSETFPTSRGKGAKEATGTAGLPKDSLSVKLAQAEQRIADIDEEMKNLVKEKEGLQTSMKSMYDELGQRLFGRQANS